MWPGLRPTCTPSFVLIHPSVCPQYTNVTDRQDRQRSDRIGRRRTVLETVAQNHHHLLLQWHGPKGVLPCRWYVARSLAFLQVEWILILAECKLSCNISVNPLSRVVRGHPRGLLQSLGGRSDTLTARWWSCLESERVTWPKKRSLLVLMILETGGPPVVSLTEVLVTCRVYGIQRIFRETELPTIFWHSTDTAAFKYRIRACFFSLYFDA